MPETVALEGLHALKHATRFGAHVTSIWTDDLDRAITSATLIDPDLIPLLHNSAEVVSRTTFREHAAQPIPTHVLAFATPPSWTLTDALPTPTRPAILLDDPRNSKNVGAVIRVAAASLASGVLIHGASEPCDRMAVRGAAGLQWAVPCASSSTLLTDLVTARGRSEPAFTIIGFDADGPTFDPEATLGPTIFAFGSERTGLSDEVRGQCDHIASLPMRDHVSSLNLATCVSAVMYLRAYATRSDGTGIAD